MAEEAEDVKVDDPIMDIMNEDEDQDTSKASSADKKEPEAAKEEKEVKPPEVPTKDTEEEVKEDPEGEAKDEEPVVEDKPKGKAEDRKEQLNTEIRDLVAQRNALKTQVEKANAEVYQPASTEELVEQGMSELEAKVEAMRQETEMEKYNTRVAEAQLTINSEAERVIRDFPIFDQQSEEFDKELADEAAELLQANLIYDQNSNQIIGSNISPYKLYKTLARASGISAVKGQIKGQKATEKMLANADTGSSAAPSKKPEDPILNIWDSDD